LLTLKGASKKGARYIKEEDLSVIKKASFVTKGSKILWVGQTRKMTPQLLSQLEVPSNKCKEYDLRGMTVLPGFVESHTHLIFSGNRSSEFELRNQGVSYQEIAENGGGIKSTMKSVRSTSKSKLVELAQQRVDRFVEQGVTALEVKSGYALDKKNEIKMLKVAQELCGPQIISTYLGPHAVPPEFKNSKQYLNFIITEMLPLISKNKWAQRVDMFIEKGYFSKDEGDLYFKVAKDLGFKCALHTEQLSRTGGFELLMDGAHSVDHMIELRASDIKKLSKSSLTCVLLPGADYYLKTAYPKARKLIDAGVRVALATDFNPGSCPTQDLSFIGVLARLEMKMSLPEVIVSYTLASSYALGLQESMGSIEAGKLANFTVINSNWRDLFYQVGYHPTQSTWREAKKLI